MLLRARCEWDVLVRGAEELGVEHEHELEPVDMHVLDMEAMATGARWRPTEQGKEERDFPAAVVLTEGVGEGRVDDGGV